jgi:hypothetical protein
VDGRLVVRCGGGFEVAGVVSLLALALSIENVRANFGLSTVSQAG